MAIWLFRNRSRRKRPRSGAHSGLSGELEPGTDGPVPRSQTGPAAIPGADDSLGRQLSSKKQRTDTTHKLQRRARTYSFETGRQDEIRAGVLGALGGGIGRKRSTRGGTKRETAPPPGAMRISGANPATSKGVNAAISNFTDEEKKELGGALAMDDELAALDRVPTLYANKRNGQHLMSRKLSKRRKNSHDREREAELKALRDFTPVRPATDAWNSGRPMKKDSRRVKSGFSLVRHPWDKEQHPSDVSLPIPESIHSSFSSDSEQISYKVSAFDVLAPKPTLRCTIYPRWGPPTHSAGQGGPTRSGSEKRKFSDRAQIPEATLRAHKRVDDLADDLSASDLRELMERDKRRRERKRESEQARIEKRLAKRAEAERRAAEDGTEPPQNLDRGVLGRESLSLGIDTTSAVVTSSRRRSSGSSPKKLGKRPAEDSEEESARHSHDGDGGDADDVPPGALHAFHRVNSIPLESTPTPANERGKAISPLPPLHTLPIQRDQVNTKGHVQDHPQSPKGKGFLLRSKKSRSKSPLSEPEQSDVSGTPRKTSESSSRGPMSWTSIFRWGIKAKRSSGPSSFSNTSRDSMSTQPQAAAPLNPLNVTFVPPAISGRGMIPKRTRSRFREDLPEMPLSPPDSRMQSPDYDPMPPVIMEQESPPISPPIHDMPTPSAPIPIPGARHDTPSSDAMRQTPTSMLRDDAEPSPGPQQSMSLASIDSEASWLSGRLRSGRTSSQMRHRGDSFPRLRTQVSVGSSGTTGGDADQDRMDEDDVVGIADDEYLSRVTSRVSAVGSSTAYANRKSTGEARPSSDEDDDARWGAVGGRLPKVVHGHRADRVKSREGLLNSFDNEDNEDGDAEAATLDSPTSASGERDDVAGLQRATSIKLNQGHARHISAGSAKLLEITPRTSADVKRKSSDHRPPDASPLFE